MSGPGVVSPRSGAVNPLRGRKASQSAPLRPGTRRARRHTPHQRSIKSGLGKEPAHLGQRMVPSVSCGQQPHGHQPQQGAHHPYPQQTPPAKLRMRRCGGVVVNPCRAERLAVFSVPAAELKFLRGDAPAHISGQGSAHNNGRERHVGGKKWQ